MADEPTFPETVDSDSDDVSWALETGRTMWTQGDHQEGLKWLKRAADTASEEEDDMRSLTLAKGAADLRNFFDAAEGQESGGDRQSRNEDEPSDKKRSLPVPKKSLPKPPSPTSSASSRPSGPTSSRPAPPPTASRPAPPPPKPSRPGPPPSPSQPSPASVPPGSSDAPPQSIDDGRPTVVQPMRSEVPPAVRPRTSAHRDCIRVAIAPHPNAINSWVARPLKDGEDAHTGERVGLLVALDGETLGLS